MMEDVDYHEMARKVRDFSDTLGIEAPENDETREIQALLDQAAEKLESIGSSLL